MRNFSMYYLIQKNVFADPRYDEIFRVLEELNLTYEIIQFSPNSNHFKYHTNRKDIFVVFARVEGRTS